MQGHEGLLYGIGVPGPCYQDQLFSGISLGLPSLHFGVSFLLISCFHVLAAALLHVNFLSFVRPEPELPLSFPQWLVVILVPKRKHFCFLGVALPLLFPRRKAPDNLDFSLE